MEIAEGQAAAAAVDRGRQWAYRGRTSYEWREQIVLRGEAGRRVLMCACSALPGEDGEPDGYVIVFDDITALMQAQRDAAWGEVARRLAHEIKNPLTPIQLSAERMRRRFLAGDERGRCPAAGPRDAYDHPAGRGDEGDGQRLLRLRARPRTWKSPASTSIT
jgi:signal transduction histidine kinase